MATRRGLGGRRRRLGGTHRLAIGLAAAVLSLAASLGGASAAWAGALVGIAPDVPSSVSVGDQAVPLSLTLQNQSNGAEADDPMTVDEITLTPSCGVATPTFACPGESADPGVFEPVATGTGAAGCAGTSFSLALVDEATGRYGLTPSPTPLALGPTGSASATCVVNLTAKVLRRPTQDSAVAAGVQTALRATTSVTVLSPGGIVNTATAVGTDQTTVNQAIATLNTLASRAPDGTISDTATLGPLPPGGPAPSGTVTFNVYGPGDATCSGPIRFMSTNPVTGTTVVSDTFLPGPSTGGPGTYRFVATYSGDVNYAAVISPCGAPGEQVDVPAPLIQVTKSASPPSRIEPGGTFTFTVQVGNPSTIDPITITSLTDDVYGNIATRPGSTCGALIGTTLAPGAVSAACSFTGDFTGVAGASQTDIVTVNGVDANGFTATDNDDATVTITPKLIASISTQVSDGSITLGQSFTDVATLTQPAGEPTPTGTVTFNVYGPGDATCTGFPAVTSTNAVDASGSAVSVQFTPTAAGTYRVVAIYGGDANYTAVSDACGAPNQTVDVAPAAPAVTTGEGSSVTDTGATLPGTVNPNGSQTAYTFEYGQTLSFGSITPPDFAGSGSSPVAVSADLTTLEPATTYYYRLVATSGAVTTSGLVRSFRTTGAGQAPVSVTGAASAITDSGATLAGQVNPKGSQTYYTIEYGTSTAFGQITPVVALDDADALEPVSETLTGLTADTTYFYRTVATNATGTGTGAVGTFTTGPGGPPIVMTGDATSVTATSAVLDGTVDAHGSETAYTFEYGPTLDFGAISAVDNAGSANGATGVSLPITGLAPNTSYRYRIVATNANGTSEGLAGSFTTGPGV